MYMIIGILYNAPNGDIYDYLGNHNYCDGYMVYPKQDKRKPICHKNDITTVKLDMYNYKILS